MDAIIILLFLLGLITLIGHGIWVVLAWFFRQFTTRSNDSYSSHNTSILWEKCDNCNVDKPVQAEWCSACGWRKISSAKLELAKDMAATIRMMDRMRRAGSMDEATYQQLMQLLVEEKRRSSPRPSYASVVADPTPEQKTEAGATASPEDVQTPPTDVAPPSVTASPAGNGKWQPPVTYVMPEAGATSETHFKPGARRWDDEDETTPPPAEPEREPYEPRRPFTEVVAAFMEQSNIRWGEIVGGLLIIGCSTALVISLWNEIARIPVLKFFIFTTVTAALFGVGFYTAHRWKLPTTSRGILTIATLLVPLNFLAIAAVSGGTLPAGAVVIISELVAPALFLCMVYFAGRVITPSQPHLLAGGVLGSSVGQLLMRHFAGPDISHTLLLALGAFPLVCYIVASLWMLRRVAEQHPEIDEGEADTIFITLGALTFAALLPFGLLLYRMGQASQPLMRLAALVTLGSIPLLASGLLLWRRVTNLKLGMVRTVGTSLAITGALISVAGIILGWPNPASVVLAALFNFVIFTFAAKLFNVRRAHLVAALCFALAYLVGFQALAGHVAWQTARTASLLSVLNSVSSGQALAILAVLLICAFEWLERKKEHYAGDCYLIVAGLVGFISFALITRYGFGLGGDPFGAALIYALLAACAFWVAWRKSLVALSWAGACLLLLAVMQALNAWFAVRFPWQAAMLTYATIAALLAIISRRSLQQKARALLAVPLQWSSLLCTAAAVLMLFQANRWQPTAMISARLFWLAGIWLALLFLIRWQAIFMAFQIALTCALALFVKVQLQDNIWYAYYPHAWLHPWSLQIQGGILVLLSLCWVGLRIFTRGLVTEQQRSASQEKTATAEEAAAREGDGQESFGKESFSGVAWQFLNSRWPAFDRLVMWGIALGFVLLAGYGAMTGIRQELATRGTVAYAWNLAGFPHEYALGPGSWILLGLLLMAMLSSYWERRRAVYIWGALLVLSAACSLLAGRFEAELASASSWRWLAAIFLLLVSLPLWFEDRVRPHLRSFGWPALEQTQARVFARNTGRLLLALMLTPLLALTFYPVLRAIQYRQVTGPSAGIFLLMGNTLSYCVPLVIVALVLIGYAVRERSALYAFAGGLCFNLTLTIAHLLAVASASGSMNRVVLTEVIQLNAIISSVYAIIWLSWHEKWRSKQTAAESARTERLLSIQVAIGLAASVLLIAPTAIRLIVRPTWTGIGTFAVGSIGGWLAFILSIIAALWFGKAYGKKLSAGMLFAIALGAGSLIAFDAARLRPGLWVAYHTLLVAAVLTGWLMLVARWFPSYAESGRSEKISEADGRRIRERLTGDWSWDAALFAVAGGALAVLLALRAAPSDPVRPWWSAGAITLVAVLMAGLNWQTLRREYLYAAGILFNLAATIWYLTGWPRSPGPRVFTERFIQTIEVNVIALALPAVVWMLLELRARARRRAEVPPGSFPAFHQVAAIAVVLALTFTVGISLLTDIAGLLIQAKAWIGWLALVSAWALLLACLWDGRAKYALESLYLLGLVTAGMVLDRFDFSAQSLGWRGMLVLAGFSLLTGALWRWRERFTSRAERLKIPPRERSHEAELKWLKAGNTFLITIVVCLAYWIDLSFAEGSLRLLAALTVMTQALALAMLAEGDGRWKWQRAAAAVFVLGAVFFGWSWLVPGVTGTWLNRAVILMISMLALVSVYGAVSDKVSKASEVSSEWVRAVRSCVPWMVGAGGVALLFVLCTEVAYQLWFGAVRINLLSLVAVAVTLLGASVMCIVFAVSPERDPLKLPESGRTKYVYVAEAMLALLFMHIRLTMPWLFTGFFEQYWPLVIVGITYLGIATSEALRRQGLMVLARPVERTGVFLPILPVLGFWMIDSRVDYSMLLFMIGLLYGGLSILRRSFGFGLLAALAGNGGLWYLLQRTDSYGLFQHPQLWLIPAALSFLIAAYLNRDRFSEEQMTSIRYITLMMIYVSSTSDIFINGVINSPWLPLILAGLSVAGVMCGIILRVRAFLFLGATFLLISVVTMIWYASVNLGWTWLWYVAGIVTGTLIIFTFAVFEKKRNEVLQVVEDLRGWGR
jgi:hypothetical protein